MPQRPTPSLLRRRLGLSLLAGGSLLQLGACAKLPTLPSLPKRSSSSVSGPAGVLQVDDGGSGTALPVLFAHSYAGSSAHWSAQLAHLRSARRAVAFDFRAHGQSKAPVPPAYEVSDFARDIAAVADGLKLQRFVLIGHSLGGAAAAAYAGTHPARVAGLMLVGTPGRTDAQVAMQTFDELRKDYEKTMSSYWRSLLEGATPDNQKRLMAQMQRMPREVALPIIAGVFSFDPAPSIRAYGGPTLIVDTSAGGSPDALFRQVPEVPRRVMSDTSHWPQLDQPQAFNALLDEFLARVR
jgi:pimeloyl-ACP methyl ester carboxylesterase